VRDAASFVAEESIVKFPNLAWAIHERGSQFQFAAQLGESESWVSRRLTGRVEFTAKERQRVAHELGYPVDWLFQILVPPTVEPKCSRQEGA
jgi:transcriptional regulator with XRE-family HTH domain